ncbi:UDP-GlcNAc:undecaprenyl-phosphate GlcNAc-1-phosphate transferase [Thiothrix caldifontis]|uniref:Undecaprenyl-phosphate alpha-N-acetylglucosaminyl 1-phosphate transferase n=1 Tax=Thiothrix caldifontis TaxID=525918 RepID=A0A1H3Z5I3_9GAMM|nr:UDP-N-acetylglucosamine--undecaprenyl-phosphate N-acetylglucosaminephosphotransferase [Thiothrix caldifontis]SEA19103.1 UDP-GlcNAc:undecaprenyl-phosphate GlcNAc-1-phosphate transferase [Thiothrix caldifontis]
MSFAGIFLLVSLVSALSILLLTPFAMRFGLVDAPNSERKFHDGNIPLIGGVSIYAGLVMGISFFITPSSSSLTYLICTSLIVALGVADDVKDLSAKFRLLVQSLVAVLMCVGSDTYIHSLGNIVGLGEVNLGALGYAVTVLAVIAAINAYNMIDGIDGLLGISSLITFVGMGILFFLKGDLTNMTLTLILSGALIPYLIANLAGGVQEKDKRLSKIFMGDTGSMLIGFTVVWLLIQGIQPIEPVNGKPEVGFSAATALWLIAFPLMDMARVIIDRLMRGQSPLKADRTHLHHILLQGGDDKRMALLRICTLSAFFAVVGIAMHVSHFQDVTIFLTFLMGFVLYTFRVRHLKRKFAE